MKFSLTLALFAVFAFAACEVDEPPRQRHTTSARYPQQTTTTTTQQQYSPEPQPFPSDMAPSTQPPVVQDTAPATTSTTTSAATTTTKSDPPYGVPVPGKPGFVTSPFSPDKLTEVRGYAPGTEVKDPYTGKIFLVP